MSVFSDGLVAESCLQLLQCQIATSTGLHRHGGWSADRAAGEQSCWAAACSRICHFLLQALRGCLCCRINVRKSWRHGRGEDAGRKMLGKEEKGRTVLLSFIHVPFICLLVFLYEANARVGTAWFLLQTFIRRVWVYEWVRAEIVLVGEIPWIGVSRS